MRKSRTVYTLEHVEEDWSLLSNNHPIGAVGCGSYNEHSFGLFHIGNSTMTRVSFNAYPTKPTDIFQVRIRALSKTGQSIELGLFSFLGNQHTMTTAISIPFNETQLVMTHVSSTYEPEQEVRVRMYVELTDA